MKKLDLSKTGKIYQFHKDLKRYLHDDFFIIQSYGIPISNSFKCTSLEQIKHVLHAKEDKRDILIVSISTFTLSEDLFSILRMQTCLGRNVYLYSFSDKKGWFCDEFIDR